MNTFPGTTKWPNVPACYEWLSLDRRGDWRLQDERVTHRGLIDFLNKQYASDDSGRWFVQNGPQRVYVDLACTPWIFRRDGERFISHTGLDAGALSGIYLDDGGNILLETALGIGLLDDRELAGFIGECLDGAGKPADEAALLGLMTDSTGEVFWCGHRVQAVASSELPTRFKFTLQPRP